MQKIISIFFLIFLIFESLKADLIESIGDAMLVVIPTGTFLYSYYQDDYIGQKELAKSLLSTTAVTYALKFSIKEERPNKENDRSFPSGHSSITMSSAVYLHKRYGLDHAIPAYVGAAFTGYSRVESDNHYTHDVLAGALLGGVVSYYFTTRYDGFELKPIFNLDHIGLGFKKSW